MKDKGFTNSIRSLTPDSLPLVFGQAICKNPYNSSLRGIKLGYSKNHKTSCYLLNPLWKPIHQVIHPINSKFNVKRATTDI